MRKAHLNFIVDALGLIFFFFIISSGLILEFILPPGSGSLSEEHVTGFRGGRPVLLLWGLSRHQWGNLHFYVSLAFLALMAFHLFLHWRWVWAMIAGARAATQDPALAQARRWRIGLAFIAFLGLIGLLVAPWFIQVEEVQRSSTRGGGQANVESFSVRGSMSLNEIAESTGMSLPLLYDRLGLPSKVPSEERLGRLQRDDQVLVEDVRRVVEEYLEEN